MIERLHHLALVEVDEFFMPLLPDVLSNRICASIFQCRRIKKLARIVGHMEHSRIANRPHTRRRTNGAVNQHRIVSVNRLRQSQITAGPEDWGGATIWVN